MNLKYEVGQIIKRNDVITGITIGNSGVKYQTKSGAYTEAELDKFVILPAYEPTCACTDEPQPIAPQEDKARFKVGQKVKVIGNCCCHSYSKGTILTLVRSVNFLRREPDWYVGEGTDYVSERDIEPYAEPEKEPEPVYYSGIVKCEESYARWWTANKKYAVIDGAFTDNEGDTYGRMKSVEDLNKCLSAKFIPYLGE